MAMPKADRQQQRRDQTVPPSEPDPRTTREPSEQSIEYTHPLCQSHAERERARHAEQGDQRLECGRHVRRARHIRKLRCSVPDPKRDSIDLMGILDGGVEDKISDVVLRMVRQRIAEGPIPSRLGLREPVPLLQLESGGIIDGQGPPDMDTHGAIPERQPQHRIRRSRQRPAQQPGHHQARGQARSERAPVHRCLCPTIKD